MPIKMARVKILIPFLPNAGYLLDISIATNATIVANSIPGMFLANGIDMQQD
jgi:hypothetical protein